MKPTLPIYLYLFSAAILMSSCRSPEYPEMGIPLELAKYRHQRISDVKYRLRFDLPDSMHQPIPAVLQLDFTLDKGNEGVALDFRSDSAAVRQLFHGEKQIPVEWLEGHLILGRKYVKKGRNQFTITFNAGEGSLNRHEDFCYTLLVPDRASTVFPCFDQPDLKAVFELELSMPADWKALANGAQDSVFEENGRRVVRFKPTKVIPTYLFAFAAGKFETITATRNGRSMTMFHRETDESKVARNREAIFDLHAQALQWLEQYTGISYPFDKFDFALIPSFQYGGMEHVGAIFYNANSLLLDPSATDNQYLGRASLIAHETAHMWFGDLVTMRWFDDVWMKEVFANFMAAKIVTPAFPEINHRLRFLFAHHPGAYAEDRSGGSHPIQQPLENLNNAGSLYGNIIYQKAPVVMRQLEYLVGEEPFQKGLQQYLKEFSYGNASWDDLIAILDEQSPEDLRQWSQAWVKAAGMPQVAMEANEDGSFHFKQLKTTASGLYWTQFLEPAFGLSPDSVFKDNLTIKDGVTHYEPGVADPVFQLANGSELGYGYFPLDDKSREYLLLYARKIKDPLLRGAAWMALQEDFLNGNIPATVWSETLLSALDSEEEPLNRQWLLGVLEDVYWRYLTVEKRDMIAPVLERMLWDKMEAAPDTRAKIAWYRSWQNVLLTDSAITKLRGVWNKSIKITGVTFSETDFTGMAAALAIRGVADASELLQQQLDSIKNVDRKKRFAFVLPALSADPDARDVFFKSLADARNRQYEPWVLEGLEYLHHPLRAAASVKYIRPSLDLLEEIQRTGDIFFPKRWCSATFSGHRSAEAAAIIWAFLHERPDYPYRLRNKILQAADPLFRAVDNGSYL